MAWKAALPTFIGRGKWFFPVIFATTNQTSGAIRFCRLIEHTDDRQESGALDYVAPTNITGKR